MRLGGGTGDAFVDRGGAALWGNSVGQELPSQVDFLMHAAPPTFTRNAADAAHPSPACCHRWCRSQLPRLQAFCKWQESHAAAEYCQRALQ